MKNSDFYFSCLKHWASLCCIAVMSFMLISCLPGADNEPQGEVSQQMEQKRNIATSYARAMQQYAALSQQVVLKNMMQEQGVSYANINLVDVDSYANEYNIGRADDIAQSGVCNGQILTWMRMPATPAGSVANDHAGMKGLGSTGFSNISQALAQQTNGKSFGTFHNGVLKTSQDNHGQTLNCAVAQYIPDGSPVLIAEISAVSYEYETLETERRETACPNGVNNKIETRSRTITVNRKSDQVVDTGNWGDWEVVSDVCNDSPQIVSLERSSAVADNETQAVNFAAGGLNAQETEECFTATIKSVSEREDGIGGGQQSSTPEVITNCGGFMPPSGDITDPLDYQDDLVCDTANPTYETTTRNCTGNGWSGTADYRRAVYDCEMIRTYDSGSTTVIGSYTRRDAWEEVSISCQRPEDMYIDCPYTDGLLTYQRTNQIVSFDLIPTNPSWGYASGSCTMTGGIHSVMYNDSSPVSDVTSVENCKPNYVGNNQIARTTLNGSYVRSTSTAASQIRGLNPSDVINMRFECGAGNVCTEVRANLACPVSNMAGSRTEKRTYACSATNTGAWNAWTETFNNCNCTVWSLSSQTPTCYGPEGSSCGVTPEIGMDCSTVGSTCQTKEWMEIPMWRANEYGVCPANVNEVYNRKNYTCVNSTDPNACQCTETVQTRSTTSCPAGKSGTITEERIKRECPGAANDTYTAWEQVSNTCTCSGAMSESRTVSCPADQFGEIKQTRSKNPATCGWNAWQTTSNTCQACGSSQNEWVLTGMSGTGCTMVNNPGCPNVGSSGGACSSPGATCTTSEYEDAGNTCVNQWSYGRYRYYQYQCQSSSTAACCVPTNQTRSVACGSGYYGNKTQRRDYTCSDTVTGSWGGWYDTNTTSCQPIICTPNSTQNETEACGAGFSGNQTRSRQCNSVGTSYGGWTSWDRSACSSNMCTNGTVAGTFEVTTDIEEEVSEDGCVQDHDYVEETQYEIRTNGSNLEVWRTYYYEYEKDGCDSGTSSTNTTHTRLYQIAAGSYSITSDCQQSGGGAGGDAYAFMERCFDEITFYQCQVCTPSSTENGSRSCQIGTGTETRSRTCASNGMSWGSWSGWNTSGCATVSCTTQDGVSVPHGGLIVLCDPMDCSFCKGVSCNNGTFTGTYASQVKVTSGSCGSTCTPGGTQNDTRSCQVGSGNETRYRTCNAQGTAWGNWSGWNTSGCTTVCTPNATENGSRSCQIGSGNETRYRTCNGSGTAWGNWSGWNTSGCTTACSPGSTETQTQSCDTGYSGNKTRKRTCNGSGTAYGSWSGWNTGGCAAWACTPGQNNTQTETAACDAGFTGNKTRTRTRTCNSSGQWGSYGGWSGWNTGSCVADSPSCSNCDVQYNFTGCSGGKSKERWCIGFGPNAGTYGSWSPSCCYPSGHVIRIWGSAPYSQQLNDAPECCSGSSVVGGPYGRYEQCNSPGICGGGGLGGGGL